MAPISVAFDMTFANRHRGGSGAYARSLLATLSKQGQIVPTVISGPEKSNFALTTRWLLRGAHDALAPKPPDILHCPSFVMPWAVRVPMVVTVHDAASRRFPGDHPLERRRYVLASQPRPLWPSVSIITRSHLG